MIQHIPEHLLEYIRGFLTRRPKNPYQIEEDNNDEFRFDKGFDLYDLSIKEDTQWRNLMNTTKMFYSLKRKSISLTLIDSFAVSYSANEEFRQRVHALIEDPTKQLHIKMRAHTASSFDVSSPGCNSLVYRGVKKGLDFQGCKAKVVRLITCFGTEILINIPYIEVLKLDHCGSVQSIESCQNLKQLYLHNCKDVKNLANLPQLQALYVRYCPKLLVSDEILLTINHLWIGDSSTSFPTKSSIKSLMRLKHLSIFDKDCVEDEISNLPCLETLKLDNCKTIKITRIPKQLKRLEISSFTSISNIHLPDSSKLEQLVFTTCPITKYTIDFPFSLKKLVFQGCASLKNIDIRSAVQRLVVSEKYKIGFRPTEYLQVESEDRVLEVDVASHIPTPKLQLRSSAKIILKEQ